MIIEPDHVVSFHADVYFHWDVTEESAGSGELIGEGRIDGDVDDSDISADAYFGDERLGSVRPDFASREGALWSLMPLAPPSCDSETSGESPTDDGSCVQTFVLEVTNQGSEPAEVSWFGQYSITGPGEEAPGEVELRIDHIEITTPAHDDEPNETD